jgi:hypothetical protein
VRTTTCTAPSAPFAISCKYTRCVGVGKRRRESDAHGASGAVLIFGDAVADYEKRSPRLYSGNPPRALWESHKTFWCPRRLPSPDASLNGRYIRTRVRLPCPAGRHQNVLGLDYL